MFYVSSIPVMIRKTPELESFQIENTVYIHANKHYTIVLQQINLKL